MVEVPCMTLYGHVPNPIAPIYMTHHLKMVPLLLSITMEIGWTTATTATTLFVNMYIEGLLFSVLT
jgi:hypothetical protein